MSKTQYESDSLDLVKLVVVLLCLLNEAFPAFSGISGAVKFWNNFCDDIIPQWYQVLSVVTSLSILKNVVDMLGYPLVGLSVAP